MASTALIIDDNSIVRHLLRLEFERRGWVVTEAKDPFEGLMAFREVGPRLVTLDLLMPINNGIDSLELARLIRVEDPAVAVLVVSSFAAAPEVQVFFAKQRIEIFEKASADNPTFDRLFERVDELFPQQGIFSR